MNWHHLPELSEPCSGSPGAVLSGVGSQSYEQSTTARQRVYVDCVPQSINLSVELRLLDEEMG